MRAYLTRISETAKESLIDGTQLSKEEEDFVLIRLPRDVAPVLMPAKSEVAKGNAVHVDGLATFGIRPNQTNRAGLAMSEGGRPEVAELGAGRREWPEAGTDDVANVRSCADSCVSQIPLLRGILQPVHLRRRLLTLFVLHRARKKIGKAIEIEIDYGCGEQRQRLAHQ